MKRIFLLFGLMGFFLLFGAAAASEAASLAAVVLLIVLGALLIFLSVCGVRLSYAAKRRRYLEHLRRQQERIVFRTRISYRPVEL